METFLQVEDYDLWLITTRGLFTPKNNNEGKKIIKIEEELNNEDKWMLENNAKVKLIIYIALGFEEFSKIIT